MCTDIDSISELAKDDPQRQFFSIAQLLTPGELHVALPTSAKGSQYWDRRHN
jgi:hypothetical protein